MTGNGDSLAVAGKAAAIELDYLGCLLGEDARSSQQVVEPMDEGHGDEGHGDDGHGNEAEAAAAPAHDEARDEAAVDRAVDAGAATPLWQVVQVAGMKLAVANEEADVLDALPADFTLNNRLGSLCLGSYTGERGKVFVLNIEQLIRGQSVMPDWENPGLALLAFRRYPLAMPCDAVLGKQPVDPQAVTWRGENSARRWLAGTLKEQGLALLDIDGLMASLSGEAK